MDWHIEWHCVTAARKAVLSASEAQLDTHGNEFVLGCQGYINQID